MTIKTMLLGLLFAASTVGATESFRVTTSVQQNGKVVASPIVEVKADTKATIRIGEDFELEVTVKPQANDMAVVATSVRVGKERMQPSFEVAYGKKATIKIDAQQLELQVDKVAK